MSRLGPRLREARQRRGMRLVEVAEKAAVTKGFLSLAERGLTSVSVPTLLRICDVLGIALGSLFDYPDGGGLQAGEGAPLEMGGEGIEEYLLTPANERHVQVMHTLLEPGGSSGGACALEAESVFVIVLRGRLELTVDGSAALLEVGYCTTFSARSAHAWRNPGEIESEVLWAIAPPIPGREALAVRHEDGRDPAELDGPSLTRAPRGAGHAGG